MFFKLFLLYYFWENPRYKDNFENFHLTDMEPTIYKFMNLESVENRRGSTRTVE